MKQQLTMSTIKYWANKSENRYQDPFGFDGYETQVYQTMFYSRSYSFYCPGRM